MKKNQDRPSNSLKSLKSDGWAGPSNPECWVCWWLAIQRTRPSHPCLVVPTDTFNGLTNSDENMGTAWINGDSVTKRWLDAWCAAVIHSHTLGCLPATYTPTASRQRIVSRANMDCTLSIWTISAQVLIEKSLSAAAWTGGGRHERGHSLMTIELSMIEYHTTLSSYSRRVWCRVYKPTLASSLSFSHTPVAPRFSFLQPPRNGDSFSTNDTHQLYSQATFARPL